MDKYKLYMIFGISILSLAIIGSTYAYYKFVISTTNINTVTRGLDYYINYTKGTDITSSTLNPGTDYTSGNNASITLYKKDNTYDIYGHIYLDISNISTALSSSNALKYVVLDGSNKISEGTLGGTFASESYLLAVNIPLKTASTKYTIYLWFDETSNKASTAENTSISAKVRCEATMKEIDDEPYTYNAARYINFLYRNSTKTSVINNNITYQYDNTHNLMKDVGDNIRYYGASPNNYIYFNCSDYSNQSSSTCEKWRIIGVFGNRVKLIRNESIGTYSWDNKNTSTGAESVYGKNDWTDARLMKLLNPGYESETTGGSLYYNLKSGNCYAGQNNATKSCDFTSTGIKNNTTKQMIAEVKYNIGGVYTNQAYPNIYFNEERGNVVLSGRPINWTGKIALAYPSDYSYAVDFSKCALKLAEYNDSTCVSNNWMSKVFSSGTGGWLLSSSSVNNYFTWYIQDSSRLNHSPAVEARKVAPALFLNTKLEIESGTGTSTDPYQLLVN